MNSLDNLRGTLFSLGVSAVRVTHIQQNLERLARLDPESNIEEDLDYLYQLRTTILDTLNRVQTELYSIEAISGKGILN